jgi:hypothetical protein
MKSGRIAAMVGLAAMLGLMLAGMLAGLLAGGCAQSERAGAKGSEAEQAAVEAGVRELAAGQRQAAFEAARDVLRELRFELNRIDAREGVLTTQVKFSSGLATPWDIEQTTARDELADLLHKHAREVRVSFVERGEELRMEVVVGVLRMQTPGQRLAPRAVALSSVATDVTPAQPQDVQSLGNGWAPHVVRRDDGLAEVIAAEVQRRVQGAGAGG